MAGVEDRPDLLAPGTEVRRYVVLEPLGEGAMGVVYAAYDVQLDRKIALKLVRDPRRIVARARLLREAQALAQLSHPNVVAMFDVGTHRDQVFVAMEFVDGRTLRRWLADAPRTRREVIDVYRRAGEGLAAAHEAGIVHRDFKPDNVLVDDRGRVLVADFGLALIDRGDDEVAPDDDEEDDGEDGADRGAAGPAADLTATGAAVGTPAYMAPEQRSGRAPVGARADQYSYCVALHEALCGARPSVADESARPAGSERDEPTAGHRAPPVPPPSGSGGPGAANAPATGRHLPARLRRVLARGLSTAPDDRYPSMSALLADLGRAPGRRRRRIAAAAAAAIALAAIAIALAGAGGLFAAPEQPCEGAAARMRGVWDGARRHAVQSAFGASGSPLAASAFGRVERSIDGFVSDWVAMHTQACEATRVRGEQSPAVLDLRMACLAERRTELGALVDALSARDVDAKTVERSINAARDLSPLARCADGATLDEQVRPPTDPQGSARVAALRARFARLQAQTRTGRFVQSLEPARQLARDVTALGYRPLEAEVLLHVAKLERKLGHIDRAEDELYQALAAGQAGRAMATTTSAWLELGWMVGVEAGRWDEGQRIARLARGALERMGGDRELESDLEGLIGTLHVQKQELAKARPHLQRSLDLAEKGSSPDKQVVREAIKRMAILAGAEGDHETALRLHRRVRELTEKALGAEHPANLGNLLNEGAMLGELGRVDESLELDRRALAMAEKAEGQASYVRASLLTNIGLLLEMKGDLAGALAEFERSLEVKLALYGKGNKEEAEAQLNAAGALAGLERYPEAIARYRRSIAIYQASAGADHALVADPLVGLGEVYLDTGRARPAIAPLERAVAIYARAEGKNDENAARARFLLARGLWAAHRDRGRARHLAQEARAGYEKAGMKDDAARVSRWIRRVH
ncbi:MAG TPA: serine/threonine-protein kinase [Kofleriaceae bacterium]|nr:serine/threonine-protein kinase [Kofleriaceae bacterium]